MWSGGANPLAAQSVALFTMQASEFDRADEGVKSEGRKVTQAIRRVLDAGRKA